MVGAVTPLHDADRLGAARARIGRTLAQDPAVAERLGAIVLRPEQAAAAGRLRAMIDRHGGALLADRVGLGKTYVALAVARGFADVVIVCPAALLSMWDAALVRARGAAVVMTMESLSRRGAPPLRPGLVIVDEAHRARTPHSRRYEELATLCRRCPVLLLTATPIQNSRRDLAALLALFLGDRAYRLSSGALADFVLRRAGTGEGMPRLDGPHPLRVAREDDWLDDLTALPPPVPASDEGVAAALWTFGLLHQWSSSRAALVASLRRRLAKTIAMNAMLEAGKSPTRSDLAAWCEFDGTVQLALPGLLGGVEAAASAVPHLKGRAKLLQTRIETLLRTIPDTPDPDVARAALLIQIRDRHPGERIIAFSQYVETVRRLGRLVGNLPRVAELTARGARIASGGVPRSFVLAQFAPDGAEHRPDVERIELLLATDVLSEGLNLQRASVIVHLDLPWNPARLEQRVGRAARLGSPHAAVTVYMVEPPAPAERVLAIQRRLHVKLRSAGETIGAGSPVLPCMLAGADFTDTGGDAEALTAAHQRVAAWTSADPGAPDDPAPVVAATRAPARGYLAAVRLAGAERLVANLGDGVTTAPSDLLRAVAYAEGPAASPGHTTGVLAELCEWLAYRRAERAVEAERDPRPLRTILRRIETIVLSAPRHRRGVLATLAREARRAVAGPSNAGAERALAALAASQLPEEAWLRAIAACAGARDEPSGGQDAVLAVILFV